MNPVFRAVEVCPGIHWVGAIDWAVRDFHGYRTSRGTTYNAFLIRGEKTILVDTVKAPFKEELLSRIASVCDPSAIDIIVSNHAEMDHSGCLPDLVERIRPERVLASAKGVEALKAHFHDRIHLESVKDGQELLISGPQAPEGPLSLRFLATPFLHWPDSMFSYLPERKVLFSQDAFGMHLASSERWAEALPDWMLEQEAAKYFANILMPFGPMVRKLLEKLEAQGLDIQTALPDHGPFWGERLTDMLGWYRTWSRQEPSTKVVILYDTMWDSTETMARAVAEGVATSGAKACMVPLSGSHRSDLATEILDAGALIVGSPTLNNQLFPTMADALTYLKGLKPKNLLGGAFGSFGWSGESLKQLEGFLSDLGVTCLETVKAQYVPREEILERCRTLGARVGETLIAKEWAQIYQEAGTL